MEEEARQRLQEVRRTLHRFHSLVRSPGWAELREVALAQIATRQNLNLGPIKDTSGIYEQEYRKGEVAGIQLFLSLPDIQIDTSEAILGEARATGVLTDNDNLGDDDET